MQPGLVIAGSRAMIRVHDGLKQTHKKSIFSLWLGGDAVHAHFRASHPFSIRNPNRKSSIANRKSKVMSFPRAPWPCARLALVRAISRSERRSGFPAPAAIG